MMLKEPTITGDLIFEGPLTLPCQANQLIAAACCSMLFVSPFSVFFFCCVAFLKTKTEKCVEKVFHFFFFFNLSISLEEDLPVKYERICVNTYRKIENFVLMKIV